MEIKEKAKLGYENIKTKYYSIENGRMYKVNMWTEFRIPPVPITYREYYCTACDSFCGLTRDAGFGPKGHILQCDCRYDDLEETVY